MPTNEEILQSRVKTATKIIQPYLKEKESAEEIINKALTAIGIDSTDIGMNILMAPTTTASDFEDALKMQGPAPVLPSPRVKAVWLILIGKDPFAPKEMKICDPDPSLTVHQPDIVTSIMKTLEQQKPIGQWDDMGLLQGYGKNSLPQIEEELLKRSKGRPCIAFDDDDGKVLVTDSLDLLKQARHIDTPRSYLIRNKMYKIYKIGDFPGDITHECPIHSNILLVNGYCEECGLRWDNFEDNKRKYIFLRLLSEITTIEPIALRAYLVQTFDELAALHPKVAMKFKDLEEEEKLPALKHRYSSSKNGDPFRVVHKQY